MRYMQPGESMAVASAIAHLHISIREGVHI
jgi:hypothetical protein